MTLARLRELEQAATPGPWTTGERFLHASADIFTTDEAALVAKAWPWRDSSEFHNAAFIAAARNALPLLLDIAEAAKTWTYDHNETSVLGRCPCSLCTALAALEGTT